MTEPNDRTPCWNSRGYFIYVTQDSNKNFKPYIFNSSYQLRMTSEDK